MNFLEPRQVLAWTASLLLMACGCDRGKGGPPPDRGLTGAGAEEIAGRQVKALGDLSPKEGDPERDRLLSKEIVGLWKLRDVPKFHYRMLDETKVEKVDAPHTEAFLEFRPDGSVSGTQLGSESAPDGVQSLVVYDRIFEGTWEIRAGMLITTIRAPNHTLTIIETINLKAGSLRLAKPQDPSLKPKVFVRPE